MKNIVATISGVIFGMGLAISGMSSPAKVQGFLDVLGDWDPSLLFVFSGALGTSLIAFNLLLRRKKPVLADKFILPTKKVIDKPLIIGAIIFGVGWALVGYCPGPAFAALAYLQVENVIFVVFMVVGSFVAKSVFK